MSDQQSGIAGKLAGAGALVTGAATTVGLVAAGEWSALAERAGIPVLFVFLLVWLAVRVGSWAAPYFRDAFNLHKDFVVSVKSAVEQQAQAIRTLADGHADLSSRLDSVCTEQRETNRLLRAASQTPQPPVPRG